MAVSNALNLSMAFSTQYPASSLAFNLSNSFISGGTPGNANSFLKAPGTTGSCTWAVPTFSPSNATITTPITAPSFVNGASSTVASFLSANTLGILCFNSTISTVSMGSSVRTIFADGGSNILGQSIVISSTGGLSAVTRVNGATTISISAASRFTSTVSTGELPSLRINTVTTGTVGSRAAFTLPATSVVGDYLDLVPCSLTAGVYRISQAAGQYIILGGLGITTVGTGGYIESNGIGVSISLICIENNLGWAVCGNFLSSSLTIV